MTLSFEIQKITHNSLHAETFYFISFTGEIEDSASEEDKDKDNEKMKRKHTESRRQQVRYIL